MDRSFLQVYKSDIESIVRECIKRETQICDRCILRYCNAKQVFTTNCTREQMTADLSSLLVSGVDQDQFDAVVSGFCNSCLNTLAEEFVTKVSKLIEAQIREQGLDSFEDFQLVIHLPTVLTLRNNYFLRTFHLDEETEIINVKEVFRVLLASKLCNVFKARYNADSGFIIEFSLTHVNGDKECNQLVDIAPDIFYQKKCRKSSALSFINHSSVLRVINQLNKDDLLGLKLNPIAELCGVENIHFIHEPIYIAGRYTKYSRNLSQTPWLVNGDTLFMSSVQEQIAAGVQKYISCKDIKFSSSGREDVDVRMLGRGRPFLLEIQNPRPLISENLIDKIKSFINLGQQDVQVRDLQFVDKVQSMKYMKEGEQEKTKSYQALCCLSRPFTTEDFDRINSTKELKITQSTPIRVLHRRTLSDRIRTIHELSAERVEQNELDELFRNFVDNIFKLNLVTEAGTYIKEFVHSDFGRTTPNLSSLLGNCTADIITLDVMEINTNWPPTID